MRTAGRRPCPHTNYCGSRCRLASQTEVPPRDKSAFAARASDPSHRVTSGRPHVSARRVASEGDALRMQASLACMRYEPLHDELGFVDPHRELVFRGELVIDGSPERIAPRMRRLPSSNWHSWRAIRGTSDAGRARVQEGGTLAPGRSSYTCIPASGTRSIPIIGDAGT